MISAIFSKAGNSYKAVTIEGHSGYAKRGKDIVCAAVSSAVMLAANLLSLTNSSVSETNAQVKIEILNPDNESDRIISALKSHLLELEKDYPDNIKVS